LKLLDTLNFYRSKIGRTEGGYRGHGGSGSDGGKGGGKGGGVARAVGGGRGRVRGRGHGRGHGGGCGDIRNSTMSLTTLVLCFFISQICFWDHEYVFHLGKVFYHLVEVIFNLFASMFLTLCPNLSNFFTSSHVPREMSHMASLVCLL
jgi:hypothetical protein